MQIKPTDIDGTIPVSKGGTGATTLTGYMKGNGTGSVTASATIAFSDITGTVPVNQGGTNATTAAGARTNLGLDAGGAGDIWVEKAGDTMTGPLGIGGIDSDRKLTVQYTIAGGVKVTTANLSSDPAAFSQFDFKASLGRLVFYVFNENWTPIGGFPQYEALAGVVETNAAGGANLNLSSQSGKISFYTNNIEQMRIQNSGTVQVSSNLGRGVPVTKTADFTVALSENWLINNKSGSTCVVTLPTASSFPGREIMIKNIQTQLVNSASSNVVPLIGGAAGTAILPLEAGSWCTLVSDGTNWVIMQS